MKKIKTGDILFTSGTSWLSRKIRETTNSPYSHVGVCVNCMSGKQTTTLVVEAVGDGVVITPLFKYLRNYKNSGRAYPGKVYIGRYKGNITAIERNRIGTSALLNVGVPYDDISIVKQALNDWFGWELSDNDDYKVICSELVKKCYGAIGIPLKADEKGFYTPASLSRSFNIEKIHYSSFRGR